MSCGHTKPLTICDRDCAGADGCRVGGFQCDGCRLWFYGEDLERMPDERYLCEGCAEEYRKEHGDDGEATEQ